MERDGKATWVAAGLIVFVMASVPLAQGCKRKDKDKCETGKQTVQQAIQQDSPQLARQWREYAYKNCDDWSELAQLDQAITAKEAELAERAARTQQAKQQVQLLTQFMRQQLQAPTGVCAPEKDPQEGWCTRTRALSNGNTLETRYRKDEPALARFSTKTVAGEITCEDLGGTQTRTWDVQRRQGGVATRKHCSLSNGFDALVSVEPENTIVTIQSSKYPDPNFRRQLEQEGK